MRAVDERSWSNAILPVHPVRTLVWPDRIAAELASNVPWQLGVHDLDPASSASHAGYVACLSTRLFGGVLLYREVADQPVQVRQQPDRPGEGTMWGSSGWAGVLDWVGQVWCLSLLGLVGSMQVGPGLFDPCPRPNTPPDPGPPP